METTGGTLTGWVEDARKNAGMIMVLGVVTVIAGFLALVMPWASGIGSTVFVGVAIAVAGFARLFGAFHAGSFGRGALAFIGGALCVLGGLIMAARPGLGLALLTLMLGAYLVVDGIFGAVLAFHVRPAKGWGWMLVNAAIAVILGFLLLREWPLTGLWAIGTFVGVYLLFAGFSLISIASAARKMATTAA
jgi:uncharacterized membrane protein HdeD (DUF308 family)